MIGYLAKSHESEIETYTQREMIFQYLSKEFILLGRFRPMRKELDFEGVEEVIPNFCTYEQMQEY